MQCVDRRLPLSGADSGDAIQCLSGRYLTFKRGCVGAWVPKAVYHCLSRDAQGEVTALLHQADSCHRLLSPLLV